ncbi:hypothetical protein HKCCSP123_15585, partial [Rhodobacterales bacterium HKCCSP123]|nr:hypothetical protein [Rhodobacterales bacterium HKCCSP123]
MPRLTAVVALAVLAALVALWLSGGARVVELWATIFQAHDDLLDQYR